MIGIAFIIFAALIGISQGFVEVGGLLVPQLITDMPTFFDYDDITGDMILDVDGNPAPNSMIVTGASSDPSIGEDIEISMLPIVSSSSTEMPKGSDIISSS